MLKKLFPALRLVALLLALSGVLLHIYELQLIAIQPLPRRLEAISLLWSCAPYACVAALSCTRLHWPAVAYAIAALALDAVAHYEAFIAPRDMARFSAQGLSLLLLPGFSLLLVGPVVALLAYFLQRYFTRRRTATNGSGTVKF